MSDPKERFYRHFQTEITAIQDQIEDLGTLSSVGGERQDCVDTILAGISRLSNEVTDALDYVPAYDQRAYAQALKALTEKLNEATSKFAPKSRFQFKPRAAKSTNTTTLSASETVQQPQHDPRRLFHEASPDNNEPAADGTDSAAEGRDGLGVMPGLRRNYNEEIARPELKAGVRKPSFSSAKNIAIYDQTGLHIMLPSSASHATSSGSLTNLDECIVDMTVPTSGSMGAPFAGLAIKDVKKSLLVCGTVAGPVHITGVKDSVVVVAARQVRVHECERVDVYLHCRSHPIIEDCKGMQFAPLPECYMNNLDAANNQWDQVDDFKWLKTEPSPNWSLMSEEKRIPRELWEKTLSNPTLCASNILKKASVV
ncbi:tubulin binding cofactor C-domain-containing protein [Pseudomassariella vexata]|uniref:Tubulin binding cofactor C-domain-containing protein n=1 Tax=Pseudomassariella vexata TaxID=1141098 RepID=A0A1Y2DI32_9PEZI|nr:tubulin binding cofactor C-domain-containing protein [Pseudomassariella vexata]ORY58794.1 tubulin binding cofactor C-domain-containing protein [Pseudomassariella vexata]